MVYRKRKIHFGDGRFEDMVELMKKYKEEKYLLPCSDIHKEKYPTILKDAGMRYTKAVLYRTVCSNLSDLENVSYDVLVFFSPSGIESLYKNFPNFKQNNTRIAAFGPTTQKSVKDHGLRLDIPAPVPNAPSMSMALAQYIKEVNKK